MVEGSDQLADWLSTSWCKHSLWSYWSFLSPSITLNASILWQLTSEWNRKNLEEHNSPEIPPIWHYHKTSASGIKPAHHDQHFVFSLIVGSLCAVTSYVSNLKWFIFVSRFSKQLSTFVSVRKHGSHRTSKWSQKAYVITKSRFPFPALSSMDIRPSAVVNGPLLVRPRSWYHLGVKCTEQNRAHFWQWRFSEHIDHSFMAWSAF